MDQEKGEVENASQQYKQMDCQTQPCAETLHIPILYKLISGVVCAISHSQGTSVFLYVAICQWPL